ncbi:hypothetical protein [Methylobacterium sp. J-076]|uniref:hypothetical protein n=1 Tax=Methylobacterium sp. J-076 TaxID=2836655 RepID=UPI001FB87129|nr:hypothetical protein [Methylobacterium sp. J-076]MCJ2013198.1 hypothetical protein [Methylobacterium sp. J-076]
MMALRLLPLVGVAAILATAGPATAEDAPGIAWPEPDGRATISRPFQGSAIVVGISRRTAGAIDSLTWGGTQFINAHDHGRELQSAASFDGYGECLNPTEAGGNADAAGPRSTTLLTGLTLGPGSLETRAQMAYWMRPGEKAGSCPKGAGPYASSRSDDVLTKRVTLGAGGVANAIAYRATFTTAQPHAMATFEALTAYMPPDFSKFWSFDPASGALAPLSQVAGEQTRPVILATPDGSRAMGVYSPDLPQKGSDGGYGRFDFSTLAGAGNATVKWNCVFRTGPIPAGDHAYTCYTLVGTLDDVTHGMAALRTALTGQGAQQAPHVVAPAPEAAHAAGTPLYVGMATGCNAGIVTVDPGFRHCATAPVGVALSARTSPAEVALYAGAARGPAADIVTTNPHHLGGATRPIGFLAPAGAPGTPLFVGTKPGCNAGVVSTNPAHLGCPGTPVGAAP